MRPCRRQHLSVLGLAILACGRTPRIEAPPPADAADVQPVPDLPVSTLAVPFAIDLAPVIADLEKAVPRTFGSLENRIRLANPRMHVAFEALRDPFRATLLGETARVSTVIHYRGRAWYNPPIAPEISASCGTDVPDDERPRARITLGSKLTLQPDWTLHSRARVESVEPASERPRDLCRVSAFAIDVTGTVMDGARDLLRENAGVIDRAVAGIDLRARASEWWTTLMTPIAISDSVWLVIDPITARRGQLRGNGQTLLGTISLTARPRVIVGPRPDPPPRPLPDMEEAAIDEGLHILAAGVIDYDVASELLTRQLRGLSIESGGRRLTIRTLTIAGIGAGRLSLEVDFDGAARGRVFLVGAPRLDSATGRIHVPDLDFDVASSSLLVSGLAWVRHAQLVEYLRERATLPVGDAVQRAREFLVDGLNRRLSRDARIDGDVRSITPLGVYATHRALLLHAHALADARLTVSPDDARPDNGR